MPEKKIPNQPAVGAAQRAALYIRVSTEEQAMHGYSLDAQRETLTRYANMHNLVIVDYYIDEGKSARKKFQNRKEFMRMMTDVEAGRIDLILFIKLDRWFRSVKDYYKIQEILEAHNVNWKTTEEHYDTATTNGRLYINIRLSVAQDESDRDSDRIKFVFDSKVARGETLVGPQSLPLGLTVKDKHVVPAPESAAIARDIFMHYDLYHNNHATRRHVLQTYGIVIEHQSLAKMLSNRLYIGEYRGNSKYCEPLIDVELFQRIQSAQKNNIRKTPTNRIYVFSGMIVCEECGKKMAGRHSASGANEYFLYRCNQSANLHHCNHKRAINEKEIEAWLLKNIEDTINRYTIDYRMKSTKREKPKIDKANIKRKLSKLKDLYVNGLIPMEEYKADYDMYTAQLAAVPESSVPTENFTELKNFLTKDFRSIYASIRREDRRCLWRSIIQEIRIDAQNSISVFFGSVVY
ncbi:MAG: recombinase family protein [Clostridiaceae bacterium]|nr:recombinase family protein [Clostridiaceae bacterium]